MAGGGLLLLEPHTHQVLLVLACATFTKGRTVSVSTYQCGIEVLFVVHNLSR